MSNSESLHQAARSLTKVQQELPEAMGYFSSLAQAATTKGALDAKTKALITLSLAIQTKSSECLAYHVRNAIKQVFSQAELAELIVIAAYMGGGPALMAAEDCLALYQQMQSESND